jgi:hypothetical protein
LPIYLATTKSIASHFLRFDRRQHSLYTVGYTVGSWLGLLGLIVGLGVDGVAGLSVGALGLMVGLDVGVVGLAVGVAGLTVGVAGSKQSKLLEYRLKNRVLSSQEPSG